MSTMFTYTIYCDDCGDPQDDGNVGRRTKKDARSLARRYGCKQRKMLDGKYYDICFECDAIRREPGEYNRKVPTTSVINLG